MVSRPGPGIFSRNFITFTLVVFVLLCIIAYVIYNFYLLEVLRMRRRKTPGHRHSLELQPLSGSTSTSRRGSDCTIVTVLPAEDRPIRPEPRCRRRSLMISAPELSLVQKEKMVKANTIKRLARAPFGKNIEDIVVVTKKYFSLDVLDFQGTKMLGQYFSIYGTFEVDENDDEKMAWKNLDPLERERRIREHFDDPVANAAIQYLRADDPPVIPAVPVAPAVGVAIAVDVEEAPPDERRRLISVGEPDNIDDIVADVMIDDDENVEMRPL